jgi:hypothetical protein
MDETTPTPIAPLADHAGVRGNKEPYTGVNPDTPRNEMADSRGQNGEYLYPHLRTLSAVDGDVVSDPDYMTPTSGPSSGDPHLVEPSAQPVEPSPARPDAVNAFPSPTTQAMDTMKAQANEERAAQGIPPSDDPFAGLAGLARGNP